jgi:hypothetical protein
MQYKVNINGINVDAAYSEECIKDIIESLLKRLEEMWRQKGRRILVMVAAPPGAGKSTLASFLEFYSNTMQMEPKLQAIGMDGFHRRQEYLVSHETEVDGKIIPMVQIKGAPVTFDLPALTDKIKQVLSEKSCGWPTYNRHLHNPVDDAITVSGDIIVLEGNYLLLDEEGWRDLHKLSDYTIFLSADADMLKKRLVDRKEASGNSREKAEEFVEFSDMRNVRLCLSQSLKADLLLKVTDSGIFL